MNNIPSPSSLFRSTDKVRDALSRVAQGADGRKDATTLPTLSAPLPSDRASMASLSSSVADILRRPQPIEVTGQFLAPSKSAVTPLAPAVLRSQHSRTLPPASKKTPSVHTAARSAVTPPHLMFASTPPPPLAPPTASEVLRAMQQYKAAAKLKAPTSGVHAHAEDVVALVGLDEALVTAVSAAVAKVCHGDEAATSANFVEAIRLIKLDMETSLRNMEISGISLARYGETQDMAEALLESVRRAETYKQHLEAQLSQARSELNQLRIEHKELLAKQDAENAGSLAPNWGPSGDYHDPQSILASFKPGSFSTHLHGPPDEGLRVELQQARSTIAQLRGLVSATEGDTCPSCLGDKASAVTQALEEALLQLGKITPESPLAPYLAAILAAKEQPPPEPGKDETSAEVERPPPEPGKDETSAEVERPENIERILSEILPEGDSERESLAPSRSIVPSRSNSVVFDVEIADDGSLATPRSVGSSEGEKDIPVDMLALQHATFRTLQSSIANKDEELNVLAPEGKVVLVFTDIQSSTSLWATYEDLMARALAAHNECIRKLIQQHGGYEVKTQGDAFMVAFSDPAAALTFCLDLQIQLMDVKWPESILEADACAVVPNMWNGLRVRIGVHFGEPRCQRDPLSGRMDYFGNMVNTAARVESKAFGGEILITRSLLESFSEDQNSHFSKVCAQNSIGSVEMKGLSEPVELIQIVPLELEGRLAEFASRREDTENHTENSTRGRASSMNEDDDGALMLAQAPRNIATCVTVDWAAKTKVLAALPESPSVVRSTQKKLYELCDDAANKMFGIALPHGHNDSACYIFSAAAHALSFALHVHRAAQSSSWDPQLADVEFTQGVMWNEQDIFSAGPRLSVGMHSGPVDEPTWDVFARCITYNSPVITASGLLSLSCLEGLTSVSNQFLEALGGAEVLAQSDASADFLAELTLPGMRAPSNCFNIFTSFFGSRMAFHTDTITAAKTGGRSQMLTKKDSTYSLRSNRSNRSFRRPHNSTGSLHSIQSVSNLTAGLGTHTLIEERAAAALAKNPVAPLGVAVEGLEAFVESRVSVYRDIAVAEFDRASSAESILAALVQHSLVAHNISESFVEQFSKWLDSVTRGQSVYDYHFFLSWITDLRSMLNDSELLGKSQKLTKAHAKDLFGSFPSRATKSSGLHIDVETRKHMVRDARRISRSVVGHFSRLFHAADRTIKSLRKSAIADRAKAVKNEHLTATQRQNTFVEGISSRLPSRSVSSNKLPKSGSLTLSGGSQEVPPQLTTSKSMFIHAPAPKAKGGGRPTLRSSASMSLLGAQKNKSDKKSSSKSLTGSMTDLTAESAESPTAEPLKKATSESEVKQISKVASGHFVVDYAPMLVSVDGNISPGSVGALSPLVVNDDVLWSDGQ